MFQSIFALRFAVSQRNRQLLGWVNSFVVAAINMHVAII